jgi:hypothetical protein
MAEELERVTWNEIKGEVAKHEQPEVQLLVEAVEDLSPHLKAEPLFLATYNYGSVIVGKDGFQAPDCGKDKEDLIGACKESVALPIPLALVMSESVEVYLAADDMRKHVVPLRVLFPGELFGVFEAVDQMCGKLVSNPVWHVSAGPRSVQILMNWGGRNELVKEALVHRDALDIKHADRGAFDAIFEAAKLDAWPLLKMVAPQSKEPDWAAKLLLLPKRWICDDAPASFRLHNIVLRTSWRQSSFLRSFSAQDSALASMRDGLGAHSDFLLPHVRQIIAISQRETPAFRRADDDGVLGACREWLTTVLRKKNLWNVPVIVHPFHLSERHTTYYSLSVQSLLAPPDEKERGWPAITEKLKILRTSNEWKAATKNLKHGFKFVTQDEKDFGTELWPKTTAKDKLVVKHPFLKSCVKLTDGAPDDSD